MNSFIKNNYLNIIITFCVTILFVIVINFERKEAIYGDARDYYSYLVSIFINHNFTHQTGNDWFLLQTPTGTINVHTIGVSLLIAPFFFGAFLYAKLCGFETDGFSLPFQMGVHIAGIFYCAIGLIFLKKLLLQLNIRPGYVGFLIILTSFGTHLLSYATNEPGMAHVYAFALTCSFFYFILNVFQKREAKYFYLSAVTLGLVILVRPVNIILLTFIPFFFQNRYDLISTTKVITRSKHFYMSALVLFLVCFIQSIAWYSQNKHFIQDSYAGNGFYFNDPQILKMLFGFNNGLFVYVPLCLLMLFGIIPIFMQSRFKGLVIVLSLASVFYVFASYWAYNYYDGFAIRTLVDFLPIFIIAGAYLFQNTTQKIKYAVAVLATCAMLLNMLHVYQYSKGIIIPNGMDLERYEYVFLKTDKAYADSITAGNDLPWYTKSEPGIVFENTRLPYNEKLLNDSVFDFKNVEYGAGCEYTITKKAKLFYVVAEFERKETKRNSSFKALFNISGKGPGNVEKIYQAYKLNKVPAGNCCDWKKCKFSVAVAGNFEAEDKLNVFIWNMDKASFFVKNLNIKIFDYNNNI